MTTGKGRVVSLKYPLSRSIHTIAGMRHLQPESFFWMTYKTSPTSNGSLKKRRNVTREPSTDNTDED